MNADERTPGQQGYGQQTPQQNEQEQPLSQQQQPVEQSSSPQDLQSEQGQDGSMTSGQASYGNSGETDTLSQNSSSRGQEEDLGQSREPSQRSGLFTGADDMGQSGSSDSDFSPVPEATGQSGSDQQEFADQGQGALNEDLMGSRDDSGTTEIEVERSQGRDSDIEGSSL